MWNLKEKIKLEANEIKKSQLQNELNIHKKDANYFFEFKKITYENTINISIDMQKQMLFPRSNLNITYYLRKLKVFNYGISTFKFNSSQKNDFLSGMNLKLPTVP